MKKIIYPIFIVITFISCSKDGDVNFFTKSQDIAFGEQLDSLVNADPSYNVLPRTGNVEAYTFLENMLDDILSSSEIYYKDEFVWKVTIIEEDVLNAFAAPGGYLYFYTGLMKYLDNSAQLAGVMAHEVAHADRRHSTENMTKVYGFSILVGILLGNNPSKLEEIAADLAQGLGTLAFSRNHEYEADEYAVRYTADTDYYPKGVAGFFEKLEGASSTPVFLSTHPSEEDRIEKIDEVWKSLGSPDGATAESEYTAFKNLLP